MARNAESIDPTHVIAMRCNSPRTLIREVNAVVGVTSCHVRQNMEACEDRRALYFEQAADDRMCPCSRTVGVSNGRLDDANTTGDDSTGFMSL